MTTPLIEIVDRVNHELALQLSDADLTLLVCGVEQEFIGQIIFDSCARFSRLGCKPAEIAELIILLLGEAQGVRPQ